MIALYSLGFSFESWTQSGKVKQKGPLSLGRNSRYWWKSMKLSVGTGFCVRDCSSMTSFGGVVSADEDSVHCLLCGLVLLLLLAVDDDDCLSGGCDVFVLFVVVGAVIVVEVCCSVDFVGWSVC